MDSVPGNAASAPPFACPICNGDLSHAPVIAEEQTAEGLVAVRRCPACDLHFTYPRWDDPQVGYKVMTHEKWQQKYGEIERGERLHDRHKNYLEEVALIQQYLPQGGRVLDIGCNAGWLLGYLQKGRVKYELEGVEPSVTLSEIARRRLNIPIHNCYLQDLDPVPAYDAVVATDLIEHINPEDINAFVSAIHQRLKPGGYAFIKTPNVRFTAIKARVMGMLPAPAEKLMLRSREMWDAKEHVIQWSEATLGRCFEQNHFKPTRFFVPLPVQTRNSPLGALITRQLLYQTANLVGGRRKIPAFAQDILMVAQKV